MPAYAIREMVNSSVAAEAGVLTTRTVVEMPRGINARSFRR
jgi:hypothetical protein